MPYHSAPLPPSSLPSLPAAQPSSSPLSSGISAGAGAAAPGVPVTSARTASAYNGGSVNNPNLRLGQTVRVFDSFYDFDTNVNAAEYDVVYSFFRKEMTTAVAAGNFTVSLFKVAQETGIPPLTLLAEFEGSNGINLNVQLAYYLNQIRNRATLLGVGVAVTPNFYPARAVLQ